MYIREIRDSIHLPFAPYITALSNDVAVAVFLNKAAVATVVDVRALETLALLVFLDGRPVTFALLEVTLELRTVSIAGNALTVDAATLKLTFVDVA